MLTLPINCIGTVFTVLWEKVYWQGHEDRGTFTFSVSLHDNGDIIFAYYSLPISIQAIHDDKHPVKIGLSDAYIIDNAKFCKYFYSLSFKFRFLNIN